MKKKEIIDLLEDIETLITDPDITTADVIDFIDNILEQLK